MKINIVVLNDKPSNTGYEVGIDDVKEIIFHKYLLHEFVFEVIFSNPKRLSVKIPYHSVLLWR